MLDNLSHWAYREIRHYRSATYENWLKACIKKACELNCFCPEQGGNLSYSEILGIAKSVANFCRKHDPYHAARHTAKYSSEKQAKRGRLGGIQSGIVRQPCEDKVTSARLMHANGMSTRQIGDELGVGKSTVARWISQL
jgi:DNA invertase Pin-like site-specific DNA recombinase